MRSSNKKRELERRNFQQSHGAVLAVLTDYGIDVFQRAEEGGHPVTEQELMCAEPFQKLAHLAVIDALMLAHLRNIVTVERVVDSVSRQTSVDDRERPMDSADALLFWINKICLLVRDDVEQSQIMLKGILKISYSCAATLGPYWNIFECNERIRLAFSKHVL